MVVDISVIQTSDITRTFERISTSVTYEGKVWWCSYVDSLFGDAKL